MKKSLRALSALAVFLTFATVPFAFAASGDTDAYVYVTEKIPGANCELKSSSTDVDKRLYKCTVQSGFATVTGVLGSLIKYATYLTGLVGVLMIVLSGIQYSLSGGGEDAKKAKGRIIQLVSGLVLLFLTGLVLNTVAPWVYR